MSKYLIKEDVDNILKEYASKAWNDDWKPTHETVRGDTFIEACLIIDDMPTVDAQPVKFARWIDLDNRILCSGCGAGYDDSDEVKRNTYIFCPNCGARMIKDGDTNG